MSTNVHGPRVPVSVEVRLLGGFEVVVAGRSIADATWRSRKARTLFKLLCLAPHHRLHREQLLDALWPDLEPSAAGNNLRSAMHAARRVLQPGQLTGAVDSLLHVDGSMIALHTGGSVQIDVIEFEQAVADAVRNRSTTNLQTAIDLYTGDLLPDDLYDDWAIRRREALRESAISLLVDLADLHADCQPRESIALLRRVVDLDPAHEHSHVKLMRLYALTDQRRQALLQYERLRKSLRAEAGVDPEPSSERLYEAILSGQFPVQQGAPILDVTSSHGPLEIPRPLTSFIGRAHELERVRDAIGTRRLLTLVGTGGVGKTRLALEVARSVAGGFPDGVWFVDLAPVADAGHLAQTVASALGVPEQVERTPVEAIVAHLRNRRVLLVLDNCEHLVNSCSAFAADLLASCATTSILATSREALRAAGELAWRVPLLDVPNPNTSTFEAVAQSDAVSLFVDRARLVQPEFQVTPGNLSAVVDICRRLDGLPLAIELAAARVPVLSVDELLARLGNALHVLTGGNRTADARHQTLRATLAWSFDLLSEPERRLIERCSVFGGGWSLEAIEDIAVGELVTGEQVLDLLANLVDKSLVVTQQSPQGRLRYRLLEPVRQYAREQLAGRHDETTAPLRHASWFLRLAEQADAGLRGGEQTVWLDRLEIEHDNLRAALTWAFEHDVEHAAHLSASLWRFWYVHGHLREGRTWIDRAYALADSLPQPARAKALLAAGQIRTCQGEYDDGRLVLEQSLAMMRDLGQSRGTRDALSALAMSLYNQGEFVQARAYVEENLRLERAANDQWGISRSLSNLAEMAYAQADRETAERYWVECLAIDVGLGDTRYVAITLHNIGEVLRARGDLVGARHRFDEALERFREIDFLLGLASSLASLAEVMIEQDDDAAEPALLEGLTVARPLGHPVTTATLLEMVGKLAARRATPERAARMFGAADAVRQSTGAHLSPLEREKLEPWLSAVREDSDESVRWAWSEGYSAPIDQRVDEALTMLDLVAEQAQPNASNAEPVAQLTRRELDVVLLVSAGLTNRELAASLGVARATADKHVSNILHKLGLASRDEARRWALAQGLTDAS